MPIKLNDGHAVAPKGGRRADPRNTQSKAKVPAAVPVLEDMQDDLENAVETTADGITSFIKRNPAAVAIAGAVVLSYIVSQNRR
jgi:hypothetical protein